MSESDAGSESRALRPASVTDTVSGLGAQGSGLGPPGSGSTRLT